MVFSSLTFLCIFLPVTFLLSQVIPNTRGRNALLIVVSVLFYAYGEPVYVLLVLASTVVNWAFGRAIAGGKASGGGRAPLTLAVVANLAFLGVFKYADFAVATVNSLTGAGLPLPGAALPLGISFYTFQALSYVIDVWRGEASGRDPYWKVLLYISFFPQIIAGPIIKYHDIDEQIDNREVTPQGVALGLRRFCYGLGKKVLIANTMASAVDALYALDPSSIGAAAAWLAAVAYALQIYFDFSGYSDMAIGLGHMFGFTIMENFDYPYASVTIKEFWRRWHISLSTWFKEYLYIPLGGNRKGRARAVLNKCIVFLTCGLWHGAAWTFVLWGAIQGAFSLLEEVVPLRRLPRWLGHVYAMLVVVLSFVVFRADSLAQAGVMYAAMFGAGATGADALVPVMEQLTPVFLIALAFGLVTCLPVRPALVRASEGTAAEAPLSVLAYVGAIAVLAICVLSLAGGAYNPFIYFRF